MKKLLKTLAATLMCLGVVYAYGETQYEDKDGIRWYYTVEDDAATITDVSSTIPNDIVVPGTLGGKPVVAIGRAVFPSYSYSNLMSLVFPDSLREIVEENFGNCPNLTNVTFGTGMEVLGYNVFADKTRIVQFIIPEGNPNFAAEGGILYSKDKTVLVRYAESARTFEIPETVTVIGEGAFYYHDLTNVTFHAGIVEIRDYAFACNFDMDISALPSGLTVIGEAAFRSCMEIRSVVIPDGVPQVSSEAFNYCYSLSSLTIGSGVGEICDYAFGTCTSLVSVVIPSCVTNIQGDAFVGCTSLSDVTIGSGVAIMGTPHSTEVDDWGYEYLQEAQPAFGSCNSLMNYKLASGNATFEEIGGCLYFRDTPKTAKKLAAYPSGRETLYFAGDVNVTELGETSCSRCDKFVDITIPDSVREIGPQSMVGCASLEKLTIPAGPTNISAGAFMLNMGLRDVEIAGTVKTIGAMAFQHENMDDDLDGRRLVLHEGIESIGAEAFSRGRWIHELVVPDSVTSLAESAFAEQWMLKTAEFGTGVTALPAGLLGGCYQLESVTMNGAVASVGDGAFTGCEMLAAVSLDNAATIGEDAFNRCESLERVDLGVNLTSVGKGAFQYCYSLPKVFLPSNVAEIGDNAFANCTVLEKAYLPAALEDKVDTAVVFSCSPCLGSGGIVFYGAEGPVFDVAFMSQGELVETRPVTNGCAVGELPLAVKDGYALLGWFTKAEGGDNVTADMLVASDVTYYAHWAPIDVGLTCSDDAGVEWKYMIKGLTETHDFYVEIVGNGAYPVSGGQIVETGAINKGTAGALAIPSHIDGYPVRVIGTWAFAYCRQLTEVTIPDTVTTIRDGAFASCSNMKKVNFGANVQTVGSCAFLYCTSLNFVELPKGAELGASAFGGCESLRYLKSAGNFSSGTHGVSGYWVGGLMLNLMEGGGVDMDPLWDCTAISCIELGEEVTEVRLDGFGKGPNLRNIICRGNLPSIGGVNVAYGKTVCHVLRENYPDGLPSDTWASMELRYLEGEVPTDSVAADFKTRSAALSKKGSDADSENTFADDDEIVFSYESVERWSIVDVETQIVNRIVVKHLPDGSEIGCYDDVLENCSGNVARKDLSIPVLANLNAGEYELCLELNVNRDVAETYYGNNTTSITFTVVGPLEPVDPFTAAGLEPGYKLQGGAAPDLSKVFATVAGDGWKIAVVGLPAGLKFAQDKKTGDYTLTGVATKEVTSEVTFTATKGTEKETAKSVFEVVYPTLTVVAAANGDPAATNGVKVAGGGKYALGAKVTLKATPVKTSVFMGWFRGEELVSQNASYAYVTTAEDVTFTAKFITVGEDKANVSLSVNGAEIESAETPVAVSVMCGVALEWPVAADALSATTVKVAGLPAGLKFTDKPVTSKVGTGAAAVVVTNVLANTIYGAPSAASKTTVDKKTGVVTVTPSDVKITVTTAGKSSVTYLVKLTVDPLPAWAVGNFEGVAGNGSATMSVAASGKVSGKIALMGTNWTFKADSFAKESETVGATNFVLNLAAASGKATSDLALTLSALATEDLPRSATALADGTFGEGTAQLWRLPWADKGDADAAKLVATLAGAYSCKAAYGESSCDVTFTLDEKGAVKGSLVAPDGSKTRKATFSANALPKADGVYAAIVLPPDAKKGYPAVCEVVELIGQAGEPEAGVAYRDPGVVATAQAYSNPEASGTVSVNPKYGQAAAGKDVTLTAKPSDKHSVFYKWEITGLDTTGLDLSAATLKFKSPGTNDVFATAVFVKDTEDTDSIGLAVDDVDLKSASPTWSNFCGVAVNWDVEATALSATTVKASGLPAGLKLVQDKNTKAYTVEGVPTAASKAARGSTELAPSQVKFTVTTAGKSSKDFTVNLVTLPLPAWAVGTFDGALEGGVVQALAIDAKGKISGKILEGGNSWSLASASFSAVEGSLSDVDNLAFRATVIGKANKEAFTNEVTVTAENGAGIATGAAAEDGRLPEWTAYQNLWKRTDTKSKQPVFKKDIKVDLELGEPGDANDKLSFTFKKDGAVAFAGKVKGTKVSGSSQLVNDGNGWSVTVYAPPKAPFDGFCETYAVALKLDDDGNVVTAVEIAAEAVPDPPAWGIGHYVGYGQVEYLPATLGGLPEYLWGLVYVDMNDDFSFTGRFVPVSGPGSSAQFSGKMYRVQVDEDIFGYQADDVAINVDGANALLHFQFITMGFGKMGVGSTQCSGNVNGISFFDVLHNPWGNAALASEISTFAPGASKTIDLANYGFYDSTEGDYVAGDSLTFAFAEDGTVNITGQIFGVAVNSTTTIGVNQLLNDDTKFDCHVTFAANGRIYQLMVEVPSTGTVTSDDIALYYYPDFPDDPDFHFGLINGW